LTIWLSADILAIIFYKKPDYKLNSIFKILILVLLLCVLTQTWSIGFGLDNIFVAIVFAGIIYLVIGLKNPFFLENKVLKYLGKISYGLYMYHVVGIIIAINLIIFINPTFNGNDLFYNTLLSVLSISFTILISFLSYHFMERKILKFKDRFLK
jgi:peptidoglycan/LPS O-acetylase OafA/YrhL